MRKLLCFIFTVANLSLTVNAADIAFSGQVTDELQQPLANVSVKIANQTVKTDAKGTFEVSIPSKDYYQVKFQKDGFYPRVHTYSRNELTQLEQIKPFELMTQKAGRVMLAFAGDAMMGRRYYKPYFDDPVLINKDSILDDSKKLVAQVKPYLSIADIAALNLESQLAGHEPTQRAKKSVTFYSAPETVEALKWAGIDYVTLGNNHTYDYLDEGLTSTLETLEKAGLPFSGAGYTEADALKPYDMTINNQTYAMLGYVGWQGSGKIKQSATPHQGGAAYGSLDNIVNGVEAAKQKGALPIVQYHGSLEYKKEPTGVTEQRLKSAIDNGAALAIAHHPHVTQGLELYKNKLIAYSMGNFIFDQNFSATQHSFLLYVWLDEGEFVQAEVVPIYLKGYKPTPAMGNERISVLKRIHMLSAKRNTLMANHKGHGVIKPQLVEGLKDDTKPANEYALSFQSQKAVAIPFAAWSEQINTVTLGAQLAEQNLQYRLGTNLINGSDFEQFNWFNAPERGFLLPEKWQITQSGVNSSSALKVSTEANNTSLLGMKHFRRVYQASNPMTFTTQVKANSPVTLNIYWQGRKTRQKLFDAFKNSPKNLISSVSVESKDTWQSIDIDFNSPRIGYRSYRVLVEVVATESKDSEVLFDDFSLVEWQTAYQEATKPALVNENARMANYIGVNKHHKTPVKVTTF